MPSFLPPELWLLVFQALEPQDVWLWAPICKLFHRIKVDAHRRAYNEKMETVAAAWAMIQTLSKRHEICGLRWNVQANGTVQAGVDEVLHASGVPNLDRVGRYRFWEWDASLPNQQRIDVAFAFALTKHRGWPIQVSLLRQRSVEDVKLMVNSVVPLCGSLQIVVSNFMNPLPKEARVGDAAKLDIFKSLLEASTHMSKLADGWHIKEPLLAITAEYALPTAYVQAILRCPVQSICIRKGQNFVESQFETTVDWCVLLINKWTYFRYLCLYRTDVARKAVQSYLDGGARVYCVNEVARRAFSRALFEGRMYSKR